MGPYEHPDSFLWWSIASWCLDRRGASNWTFVGIDELQRFPSTSDVEVQHFPELFGTFLQWWPFFQPSPHRGNTIIGGWWLQLFGWSLEHQIWEAYCSILLFNRGGKRLPTSVACSLFNEGVHFCKEPENPNWMHVLTGHVAESARRSVGKASAIQVSTIYATYIQVSFIHHLTCRYHPSNYPVLGSSKWCKKESIIASWCFRFPKDTSRSSLDFFREGVGWGLDSGRFPACFTEFCCIIQSPWESMFFWLGDG